MMTRVEKTGGSEPQGPGERIELTRRRRRIWLYGTLFALGLVAGLYVGATRAESLFTESTDWPPVLAVGLAMLWIAAVIGGGILGSRATDEFELQQQYKAISVAAAVYFLAYPVWFLLWKGGLSREPMHGALFLVFWLALMLASIFYRFR